MKADNKLLDGIMSLFTGNSIGRDFVHRHGISVVEEEPERQRILFYKEHERKPDFIVKLIKRNNDGSK